MSDELTAAAIEQFAKQLGSRLDQLAVQLMHLNDRLDSWDTAYTNKSTGLTTHSLRMTATIFDRTERR